MLVVFEVIPVHMSWTTAIEQGYKCVYYFSVLEISQYTLYIHTWDQVVNNTMIDYIMVVNQL